LAKSAVFSTLLAAIKSPSGPLKAQAGLRSGQVRRVKRRPRVALENERKDVGIEQDGKH